MGKTGRWIRSFFTGKKKDNMKGELQPLPNNNGADHRPKEKRRWSFRRSSAPGRPERSSLDLSVENDAKKHALAVADLAVATAAAADAAVAAAKAAAAVIQLTAAASGRVSVVEERAAVKIQSAFRGYLVWFSAFQARKALNALRGLVKLQALVRGHLVRKQATATLRCMQALITVQARARAHRLRLASETKSLDQTQHRFRNSNHVCKIQDSHLVQKFKDHFEMLEWMNFRIMKKGLKRTSRLWRWILLEATNHFEEYSFRTAQSSPQCYSAMSKPDPSRVLPFSYARSEYGESVYDEFPLFPNYMANTESSRAKVRSHSAPKSRPADGFERQSSCRRRPSVEGRNVPRAVRMQRSSSQVNSTAQNYQYSCSVKSSVSPKESECGSTSTYRSVKWEQVQGARF